MWCMLITVNHLAAVTVVPGLKFQEKKLSIFTL